MTLAEKAQLLQELRRRRARAEEDYHYSDLAVAEMYRLGEAIEELKKSEPFPS